MLCHILYICMVALLETENFPFSKMYLPAIFFIIKTDKTYFDTLNHWKIPRVKTFLKHLPVCTFIWARRLVKNVNPLLQISQTYGLSPVCFLMWPTKFPENKFSVLRNIFYKIIQRTGEYQCWASVVWNFHQNSLLPFKFWHSGSPKSEQFGWSSVLERKFNHM